MLTFRGDAEQAGTVTFTHGAMQDAERNEAYRLVTDASAMDLRAIHAYLRTSYWSEEIPFDLLERAISASICFGVLHGDAQVAFARVVTDRATFAYLADVYVLEAHRGRGLSRRMMEAVMAHPDLQGLRRFLLVTRDADGLYAKFGFTPLAQPGRFMEINRPGLYRAARGDSGGTARNGVHELSSR